MALREITEDKSSDTVGFVCPTPAGTTKTRPGWGARFCGGLREGWKQVPFRNDRQKSNGSYKSNGKCNRRSRSPAGMTTKKTAAWVAIAIKATATPSIKD
jgi:hypothetical protein